MKKALIVGVTGQTGSYLAAELLNHGYDVVGATRGGPASGQWRLEKLGIRERIDLVTLNPQDASEVSTLLTHHAPDALFFLGGQSSVGESFRSPVESRASIVHPVANILTTLRQTMLPTRFVHASSTETFGDQPGVLLDENSAMRPVSPYGEAKAESHRMVTEYRDSHQVSASNAILSNHESPLRGETFVTSRIVAQLREIRDGRSDALVLGNLEVIRDWVWAPDVARALRLMAETNQSDDFLIATGRSHSLREFLEEAAKALGFSQIPPITQDPALLRPQDIQSVHTNPRKANEVLGWKPEAGLQSLVKQLVD